MISREKSSAKKLKVEYRPIEVDSEYQYYLRTCRKIKDCKPGLVGIKDHKTGRYYPIDAQNTKYKYLWDSICPNEETVRLPRSTPKGLCLGVVQYQVFFFWAVNDLRFLSTDEQFIKDYANYIHSYRCIKGVKDDTTHKLQPIPGYYIINHDGGGYYQLIIEPIDISGMLGNGGLKTYADIVGIEMPEKSKLDNYKTRMNDVFYNMGDGMRELEIRYNKGDLIGYDIYQKLQKEFAPKIGKAIGYPEFQFKATMGATVSLIVEKMVENYLRDMGCNVPKNCIYTDVYGEIVEVKSLADTYLFLNQSARALDLVKGASNHWRSAWGSKVDGGRAKNEKSKINKEYDTIIDLDIGGAYGSAMNQLIIPFGRPHILRQSEDIQRMTLRKGLKKYEKDFVPGLWVMRVSGELSFHQDFIMSQDLPPLNKMEKYILQDDEVVSDDIKKIDGSLTLRTNELKLATITHDILQGMKTCCNKSEYKEMLDNLYMDVLIFYPKSCQVDHPNKVVEQIKPGTTNLLSFESDDDLASGKFKELLPPVWYGIPMTVIVNKLQLLRNTFSKSDPREKPLNTLFKLFVNTLYGTLASVYFNVGNTVVANNITAKIRCLAWYMKTSLGSHHSITDGGAFNINQVNVRPERVSLQGLSLQHYHQYSMHRQGIPISHESYYRLDTKPLYGVEVVSEDIGRGDFKLVGSDGLVYSNSKDESDKVIWDYVSDFFNIPGRESIDIFTGIQYKSKPDKNTIPRDVSGIPDLTDEYLQSLNPNVIADGKGQFVFESKCAVSGLIKVSQAHYLLVPVGGLDKVDVGKHLKWRGVKHDSEFTKYGDGSKPYVPTVSEYVEVNGVRYDVPAWVLDKPNPTKDLMWLLACGVERIPIIRWAGFWKQVRLNDWKHRRPDDVLPGDEVLSKLRVYPFSPSQFMYTDSKQYEAWKRFDAKIQQKTGFRLEALFIDIDNLIIVDGEKRLGIDVQRGLNKLSDVIVQGQYPKEVTYNFLSDFNVKHPDFQSDFVDVIGGDVIDDYN